MASIPWKSAYYIIFSTQIVDRTADIAGAIFTETT